ncbi:MAG: hypothetical protein ACOX4Q_12235 [Syntrophomonadales bacterium]
MGRIWLLPLAIALVLMLVRPLSGTLIGPFSGSMIQLVLAGICLIIALILIPWQSPAACDDSKET